MGKFFLLSLGLMISACAPTKQISLMPDDLHALQTQEIEASQEVAFDTVLAVFTNLGYTIESADQETGWITAASAPDTHLDWLVTGSKYTTRERAKIHVESVSQDKSRLHLTFMADTEYFTWFKQKPLKDSLIVEPDLYENTFAKISNAISVAE